MEDKQGWREVSEDWETHWVQTGCLWELGVEQRQGGPAALNPIN